MKSPKKKTVMPLLSYITNVPYLPGIRGSILNSWALWTFICIVLLSRTPTKYLLTTITIPLSRDPVIIQLISFYTDHLTCTDYYIAMTQAQSCSQHRGVCLILQPNMGTEYINTTYARFTSSPKIKMVSICIGRFTTIRLFFFLGLTPSSCLKSLKSRCFAFLTSPLENLTTMTRLWLQNMETT